MQDAPTLASCNVMPLLIAQRMGVTPQPKNQIVIQLDKTKVKVIGVLKYFFYS